jgi:hypothetical protein
MKLFLPPPEKFYHKFHSVSTNVDRGPNRTLFCRLRPSYIAFDVHEGAKKAIVEIQLSI